MKRRMSAQEIMEWLTANKASVYFSNVSKLWVAVDDITSRMAETPEDAIEALATDWMPKPAKAELQNV